MHMKMKVLVLQLNNIFRLYQVNYERVCMHVLTPVAEDAGPSIGAVTSIPLWGTLATIRAVITGQTAVMTKCVIDTH